MDAKNVQIEITPFRSPTNSCLFTFIPHYFTSETLLTTLNKAPDAAPGKLFAACPYILPEKDELINVKGELINVTGELFATKSYLFESSGSFFGSKRYPVNLSRYRFEPTRYPVHLSRYLFEPKRSPVDLSRYPVVSSRYPVVPKSYPVDSSRHPFNCKSFPYAISGALFGMPSLIIAHLLNFLIKKFNYIYFSIERYCLTKSVIKCQMMIQIYQEG
jgi:hypothetical protein